jgi:hypothetical protein
MITEAPNRLPKSVRKTLNRAEKDIGAEQDKRAKENEKNKAIYDVVNKGMNLAFDRSRIAISSTTQDNYGRIANNSFQPITIGNLSLVIGFTYEGEISQNKPTMGSSEITITAIDASDTLVKTTLFTVEGNYPNFKSDGEYKIKGGKGKKRKRAEEALALLNVMTQAAASEQPTPAKPHRVA